MIEKKNKKKIDMSSIFFIFLRLYLLGIVFFMFFTIPTRKLNGKNIGLQNLSSIEKNLANGQNIEIYGNNDDKIFFDANDISYIAQNSENDINQKPLLWIIDLLKGDEIIDNNELSVSYDYDKLKSKLIDSFISKEGEEPVNAQILFNEEKNEYYIEKEKMGSKIDFNKAVDRIISELDKGNFNNISISEEYEKPKILSTDKKLQDKLKNINKIKDMEITYDFYYTKEVLKGKDLVDMYKDENGKLVADDEKTKEYLIDLAIKYDTFNTERKFKAKDIGEITVPPGIYGWEINVNDSNKELIKALNNKKSVELEPIYRIEGVYRDEYNDIGSTYVEIDIGRQHLWYFKDGEEVYNAPFVSGKDTDGRRTTLGVNQLWSKQRNRYLTGETWKSYVNYWMPIDWSGIGLHDASWRSSFGGEIYKWGGSHGCINMPYNHARDLYNMVELYTPVVVYDSTKL